MTANDRASGMDVSLPWRGLLPIPDGTVDASDRKQTNFMYRTNPFIFPTVPDGFVRSTRALNTRATQPRDWRLTRR